MIKKFSILFAVFSFIMLSASAQMENPVQWSYSAKKIADKTYELHITANLEGKWHIYAQDAGEGPVPTEFSFTTNPLVKMDGKVLAVGKGKTKKQAEMDAAGKALEAQKNRKYKEE